MSELEAPTIEDVLTLVRAIASPGRGAEDLEAEAWHVLWRARRARRHRATTGRAHPEYGDGSLSGAAAALRWSVGGPERLTSQAMLRAGAAACRVLAGDAPASRKKPVIARTIRLL